jgi:hypothetical protein
MVSTSGGVPWDTRDEFLLAATAQDLRKLAKQVPSPGLATYERERMPADRAIAAYGR